MSTYTPIASQTLDGTASSVIFSSIPQGYTDIRIVVVTAVNTATHMRFNSDSGSNYSLNEIWANTSPIGERATNVTRIDLRNSSSTLGNNMATVDIMSYSNSTTYKTLLTAIRDGLYDRVYRQVQLWRNTAAITTITFTPDSGTFPSGSTFSLYGIQVGQAAQKAQGGNIVTTDGTYVYHTFTSSGAFIPSEALTVDYLVVAGGGGGGSGLGGGGGGGGFRTATSQSLAAKSYLAIIGAGGAGTVYNTNPNTNGANGTTSSFNGLESAGGGGGGGATQNGNSGGSGGGGGGAVAATGGAGNTPSTSPSQGNTGGTATSGGLRGGGGGGGAGAVGGNAPSGGGTGGNGTANSYSGTSVTYAGGGGGGSDAGGSNAAGGTGGGGAGRSATGGLATAGTANLGGGGGGGANSGDGGNGGSGVVIIRYAI